MPTAQTVATGVADVDAVASALVSAGDAAAGSDGGDVSVASVSAAGVADGGSADSGPQTAPKEASPTRSPTARRSTSPEPDRPACALKDDVTPEDRRSPSPTAQSQPDESAETTTD